MSLLTYVQIFQPLPIRVRLSLEARVRITGLPKPPQRLFVDGKINSIGKADDSPVVETPAPNVHPDGDETIVLYDGSTRQS